MGKTVYRVAVASTDGIVVNGHFGRAKEFLIYQVERQNTDGSLAACLLERRKSQPVCQGGSHNQDDMERAVAGLADCDYVLVERAGMGACQSLEAQGTGVFELPGMIEESLRQMDRYLQVDELF